MRIAGEGAHGEEGDGRAGSDTAWAHVGVNLYAKGAGKAQMTVQQSKLPTAEEADQARAFWREALERLQSVV